MAGPSTTVWVEVATELLAELGEWSEPVQVRIHDLRPNGQIQMEFRRPAPDEGWRIADEPTTCPDSSLLAWGLHEVDPDGRWEA